MITTEEIAQRAYQLLTAAVTAHTLTISGVVDYERTDYSKEDVIIVPHTSDGEASLRFGQINVNIHVPDLTLTDPGTGKPLFRIDYKRLTEIRAQVIAVLQNYVEPGSGWNWYIGRLNPAIKEKGHDEHFMSLALQLVIREKNK